MSDEPAGREQGVDFSSLESLFEDLTFPVSVDELVDEYGDREIERTNAEPITLRDVFGQSGDETFRSADELRQGILNLMPREAVGREEYSDRGGSSPDATEEADRTDEDESL